MSRRFYFGSPSDSDDDNEALPFPEPLPRNAFLTPDFTATDFLSSLRNRHQTLEDLRSDLRTRSQELSKELLDLVNDNYEEFLGLGNGLRGGEEKVEEIRVGLLGFKREIDTLREKTELRKRAAAGFVAERLEIIKELRVGNDLLEIDTRLEELETSLEITSKTNGDDGGQPSDDIGLSDESESDSDDERSIASLSRIQRRVLRYTDLERLIRRVGQQHPFIVAQESRRNKIKETLLVDLSNVLKECGRRNQAKSLKVLKLYDQLREPTKALNVLRSAKKN